MKTKNGIVYELELSDYRTTENGLTYVFSSQLYLDKFKAKLEEHRKTVNESLSRRFDINIKIDTLADIVLYSKIEKRGYLIVTNEDKSICRKDNLTFVGGNVTLTNSNEPLKM